MITLFVAALFLLCFAILIRRYNARKKRRELFLVKQHVARYEDQNQRPVA